MRALGRQLQRLAAAAGRVRTAGRAADSWRRGEPGRRDPGGAGGPGSGRRGRQLSRHGPRA